MEADTPPLQPSSTKLRTYIGECIKVLGAINVHVKYGDCDAQLDLLIVEGDDPTFLGCICLSQFPNVN